MRKALALLFLVPLFICGTAAAQCPPGTYTDYTIFGIQFLGAAAPAETVSVPGVVVTGLQAAGFWVQDVADTSQPWSGIYCYTNSAPTGISRGDSVDVIGVYQEYYDLSELRIDGGRGCYVVQGQTSVPVPANLTTCDINDSLGNSVAEQWEGVLVITDSLINVNDSLSYGLWDAKPWKQGAPCGANDLLHVDDGALAPYAEPPLGDTLLSITGVVGYSFSAYILDPRDNDDIVYKNALPPPTTVYAYPIDDTHVGVVFDRELDQTSAENISNYVVPTFDITPVSAVLDPVGKMEVTLTMSDMSSFRDTLNPRDITVSNVANDQGVAMITPSTEQFVPGVKSCDLIQNSTVGATDSTVFDGLNCAVGAIVTAGPTESWGDDDMMIQDRAGFGYGLYADLGGYASDTLARGDSVVVSGRVDDFFSNTQFSIVNNIKFVSAGTPIAPAVVTTAVARTEAYEGKLVRVNGLQCTNENPDAPAYFGTFVVGELPSLADTLWVDDYFSTPGIFPEYPPDEATVGDQFTYISGPMIYAYSQVRILPRDVDDIEVSAYVGIDGASDVPARKTFLAQNTPNPFNPTTSIEFSLATRSRVDLEIFDVAGRMIRTLVSGELEAGDYSISNGRAARWDGRNEAGNEVGSGIYFYRLGTEEFQSTKKMVLVR